MGGASGQWSVGGQTSPRRREGAKTHEEFSPQRHGDTEDARRGSADSFRIWVVNGGWGVVSGRGVSHDGARRGRSGARNGRTGAKRGQDGAGDGHDGAGDEHDGASNIHGDASCSHSGAGIRR